MIDPPVFRVTGENVEFLVARLWIVPVPVKLELENVRKGEDWMIESGNEIDPEVPEDALSKDDDDNKESVDNGDWRAETSVDGKDVEVL